MGGHTAGRAFVPQGALCREPEGVFLQVVSVTQPQPPLCTHKTVTTIGLRPPQGCHPDTHSLPCSEPACPSHPFSQDRAAWSLSHRLPTHPGSPCTERKMVPAAQPGAAAPPNCRPSPLSTLCNAVTQNPKPAVAGG
jgi:hypothetical protein